MVRIAPYQNAKTEIFVTTIKANFVIIGICSIENGKHKCKCKEGWKGTDCKTITCDNYNKCGPYGLNII